MKEVYPVPAEFEKTARTNEQEYFERYQKSLEQPDEYWAEQALKLDWIKPFSQVKNTSYDKDNFKIEWFADGQLNLSANCLDRHLKSIRINLRLFGKVTILHAIRLFPILNCMMKYVVLPMS